MKIKHYCKKVIRRDICRLFCFLFSFSASGQTLWSLNDCINYALINNLTVKHEIYLSSIQNKNLEIVKREFLPNVEGNILNIFDIGQIQNASGATKINNNFRTNLNVESGIMLFNNNKLKYNVDKNKFLLLAADNEVDAAKLEISTEILYSYLDILLRKELVKVAEMAKENAQKLYDKSVISTSLGSTAKTVQYEAKANFAKEQLKLQVVKNDLKLSILDLALLLQLESSDNFDIQDIGEFEAIDSNSELPKFEIILERIYSVSPKMKSYMANIESSVLQTKIVKTSRYPSVLGKVNISTFYFNSWNTKSEKDIYSQYSTNFSPQFSITANLPIFNKGIIKLQIEKSEINEQINRNLLEIEKQKLLKVTNKIFLEMRVNLDNYLTSVEVERNTKISYEFAEKSYNEGYTTIYDLNITRNNWFLSVSNLLQYKYKFLLQRNLLNLYIGEPVNL